MSKTKKIAVFFPGIGYTCDKPLLYYSAKLAAEKGYEIVRVPYGNFPPNVKGDPGKMYACFVSAREQSEDILRDVDWNLYSDVVFFSKSVGTAVALSYAAEHGLTAEHSQKTEHGLTVERSQKTEHGLTAERNYAVERGHAAEHGLTVERSQKTEPGPSVRQVLFTPLAETFRFPTVAGGAIAFHGTSDPWAETSEIVRICEEKKIPLYLTPKANHSLECGKVKKDIKTIREVMKTVEEFL